jgi:hypothetical protein
MYNKLSSEVNQQKKKSIEYDNAADWEIGLDSRYNEDDVISILNILSYWDNKRRGFGKGNDEELYEEEREADRSNILYEEAMYGLDLLERGRMQKRKRLRPCTYGNN